jgi:hypothetical protein
VQSEGLNAYPTPNFFAMKTAIVSAAVMFGVAIVISMAVAALMKVLFIVVRRMNQSK